MSAKLESIDTSSVVSNYTPATGTVSVFLSEEDSNIVYKAKKSDGTVITVTATPAQVEDTAIVQALIFG